jgi:hypothetical protein
VAEFRTQRFLSGSETEVAVPGIANVKGLLRVKAAQRGDIHGSTISVIPV